MIRDKFLKSKEFFDSFSAVIKLSILFLVGVGNYRSVLFLIVFYCTKAFIDYNYEHNTLKIIFLPPFLYTLYLDVKFGQLWLQHNHNLILFVILFVAIDHISTMYINRLVEKISNNYVFSYCSNCKFENIKLVTKCGYCGYERNNIESISINDNCQVYDDTFQSQLPKLRNKLDTNTITNLSLAENESICMSIRVYFGNGPYIDGYKQLCTFIVITNKNIIFMHKLFFQRGWRWRDKIDLESINEILTENKKVSVSTRQAIKICAGTRTLEIFLWYLYKRKDEFNKYFNAINRQILKT